MAKALRMQESMKNIFEADLLQEGQTNLGKAIQWCYVQVRPRASDHVLRPTRTSPKRI